VVHQQLWDYTSDYRQWLWRQFPDIRCQKSTLRTGEEPASLSGLSVWRYLYSVGVHRLYAVLHIHGG
jgi:hypothetical protein